MKKSKYPSEEEAQNFDFSKVRLLRSESIRLKCLDCSVYQSKEVRLCPVKSCSLWSYRMGYAEKVPKISLTKLRDKTLQKLKLEGGKKDGPKEAIENRRF